LCKSGSVWIVPWDVVRATPGMLTRMDSALPRWRTGAFPTLAWLAEHGHHVGLLHQT